MINNLELALNEKDVENFWRAKITTLFPNSSLTSPFGSDGFLESDDKISALLEFKYRQNLLSKLSQVEILCQVLWYLKKFELTGKKLPRCIFVADTNEAFAIHTNPLLKYLDYKLDWNSAPSSSSKQNPDLIQQMVSDESINPFVFHIVDGFNFVAIKNKITDLSQNVTRLIKITEHNIESVYGYFLKNVLVKNRLSVNQTVNLFINIIINPEDNFLHPKKRGILQSQSFGQVHVDEQKFKSFFEHFDPDQYTISEKEKLTSILDRLIEDETRRRKGEFFTPTIWVDEAHKMITDAFGENWKQEYIVWDPACGTLNLTRDYKFRELYCSTIEESDLRTADQMGYNPEAVKFQYDFLNDGIVDGKIDIEGDDKLPQGLKNALLEGKKIIVLMNPPYGTANNAGTEECDSKAGIADTKLSYLMKSENWGASTRQLYAQFLFRFSKMDLNNINICIYAKSLYKSGATYEGFRKKFYSSFLYKDGMLFSASHFDGVSDSWGIDFSIWKPGLETRDSLPIKIKDCDQYGNITFLYDKEIYHLDNSESSADWIRKVLKGVRLVDTIQFSSALVAKQANVNRISPNSLGYLRINTNNIMSNAQGIGIYPSATSGRGGVSIVHQNFLNSLSLFTARKSITGKYANWVNDKDEYMAPNEEHPLWRQFQYDSLVYSLFNTSSNQSSLRQITYKDKLWDIKNEFFWISKEQMMELANENYFDELFRDARASDQRHVYKLLFEEGIYDGLSPDAREVLDRATELVKLSFKMRKVLQVENPEYHLNTWDAGWYQIKLVLKKFYPDLLKDFNQKYKTFEDRMRPLVYELGFLRP
jgi:hypothetical protein